MSLVYTFAKAIKEHEGFFDGSLSFRNNNPGNLKFAGQAGAVKADEKGFAVFGTYQQGWDALVRQIEIAASGKSSVYRPSMTIREFFKKYAPLENGNTPEKYAEFVAKFLGVSPDFVISGLLENSVVAAKKRLKILLNDALIFEKEI